MSCYAASHAENQRRRAGARAADGGASPGPTQDADIGLPSQRPPPVSSAIVHFAPGIPPGDYMVVASRPGIVTGAWLTTYQQMHLGYPVVGFGWFVETKDGIVLSKNGKMIADLPKVFPKPMSEASALEAAMRALKVETPPWIKDPTRFHAPVGTLALLGLVSYPTARDFVLAWSFNLRGTGLGMEVQVNAVTGKLISFDLGIRR